ncbi:MAG: 2-amino-4-hydroxy-6-hydroxymethyldihydropteridine diphosphokinase [Acidobacteriaceae bacterium]
MTRESPQPGDATTAYIALGSNLGDREQTLRSAIAALRMLGSVDAISSFYKTAPVGIVEQPDFLNAVVALRTTLPPQELMAALLRIEQQHGRDRSASVPKGPRTLDLDLLSYGDVVMETPALTLPHPSLAERRFVLVPLAEIAPQWRHPVSGKTAAILLAELSQRDGDSSQPIRNVQSSTASS